MVEDLLKEYKQEFQSEIEQENIEVEDILKLGISKSTLALEVYLKKVYGDELFKNDSNEKVDLKTKNIKKLTDLELNKNQELQNILLELQNLKFDEQVNGVLIKIRESEE